MCSHSKYFWSQHSKRNPSTKSFFTYWHFQLKPMKLEEQDEVLCTLCGKCQLLYHLLCSNRLYHQSAQNHRLHLWGTYNVCVCVCMYVCEYVCMHASIYVARHFFIHSFIPETYIAPLQDTTTQRHSQPSHGQRRKTWGKSKNLERRVISKERSSTGRSFHADGPTTKKILCCTVAKWAREIKSSPLAAERSTPHAAKTDTGQQRSQR